MPEAELRATAFPTLTAEQIADIAECSAAAPKVFRDGEALFSVGDRDFQFFVIKSGEIEIVD